MLANNPISAMTFLQTDEDKWLSGAPNDTNILPDLQFMFMGTVMGGLNVGGLDAMFSFLNVNQTAVSHLTEFWHELQ